MKTAIMVTVLALSATAVAIIVIASGVAQTQSDESNVAVYEILSGLQRPESSDPSIPENWITSYGSDHSGHPNSVDLVYYDRNMIGEPVYFAANHIQGPQNHKAVTLFRTSGCHGGYVFVYELNADGEVERGISPWAILKYIHVKPQNGVTEWDINSGPINFASILAHSMTNDEGLVELVEPTGCSTAVHLHQEALVSGRGSVETGRGGVQVPDPQGGVEMNDLLSHLFSQRLAFPASMWLMRICSSSDCPVLTYKLDASAGSGGDLECRTGGASGTVVSCTGTFDEDTVITITADPDSTHTFGEWSGCDSVSNDDVCTVTMTAAKTVTASFTAKPTRTLTTSVSPPGGGQVSASTRAVTGQNDGFLGGFRRWTFNDGDTVYLRARPNQGYVFSQWGGNASGTSATTQIVMDGDKAVTAIFAVAPTPTPTPTPTYKLDATAGSGGDIECRTGGTSGTVVSCTDTFDEDTVITITADPDSTHTFDEWSGCDSVSDDDVCTVTMTAAKTVSASFTAKPATGGTYNTGVTTRTYWSWTASCNIGSTNGSGSGLASQSAAASAASAWVANCPRGGGGSSTRPVTTYGWTASCRIGTGSDSGSGLASPSAATTAANTWIAANCPAGGGTSGTNRTTTYGWTASCRIGTGSGGRSGYATRSAASTAATAWINANCPAGGGTPDTDSTTQWYADIFCTNGRRFTVGPETTRARINDLATVALLQCASPSSSANARDDAEPDSLGVFNVRPVTTWNWMASCRSGNRSSSGSGLSTQLAASSAALDWISRNCPVGGGTITPTSATTYGWTARCHSGGRRNSGSGLASRLAAANAASAWVATCPVGGGTFTPTSATTYNWSARCRRGGGSDSGSGFTTQSAAASAGQAWVTANCPAGGGTSGTVPYTVTIWHWSARCNSGSKSNSGSGLASQSAATTAAQAWITANCGG